MVPESFLSVGEWVRHDSEPLIAAQFKVGNSSVDKPTFRDSWMHPTRALGTRPLLDSLRYLEMVCGESNIISIRTDETAGAL